MSELVGMTHEDVMQVLRDGFGKPDVELIIAIAAQKALLRTIREKRCTIDQAPFYYLPEAWFKKLCTKLGVK